MTCPFAKRFLWHTVHAGAVLSSVLTIVEIFVPGSILIYIHLPGLIFVTFILMIILFHYE
ncbi:hypothetical protein EXS71_04740 [Candidatus Uhrbacteria bacterium]|nr:hypothetical protein [Candidatus Uhrbacteria bacterium]